MKCHHLVKVSAKMLCMANDNVYMPSDFETEEYCKAEAFRKCPFNIRNSAKGAVRQADRR